MFADETEEIQSPPTTFTVDASDEEESGDDEAPPKHWFTSSAGNNRVYPAETGSYLCEPVAPLCGLCLLRRKTYYCAGCCSKGDFIHSGKRPEDMSGRRPGNLAEKKLQEAGLNRINKQLLEAIKSKTEVRFQRAKCKEDIMLIKQRIRYLKRLVGDCQDSSNLAKDSSMKLASVNERRKVRLPLFVDKVSKISRCVAQYRNDLNAEAFKTSLRGKQLDKERNRFSQTLFKHLFPIEPVYGRIPLTSNLGVEEILDPNLEQKMDTSGIAEAMADAMSTSYIQGRWVTTSAMSLPATTDRKEDPLEYKIVAPRLSAVGDYSAFPALVSATHDNQVVQLLPNMMSVSSESADDVGPVPTISAGLSLTAQLVSQLYTFWDIIPPKRFADFGIPISSQYKFSKKVTRLNLNTIYLCLRLGIRPEDLEPAQTLKNLHMLVNRKENSVSGKFPSEEYYRLSVQNYDNELGKLVPSSEDLINDDESDSEELQYKLDDDWEEIDVGQMMVGPSFQTEFSSTSFVSSLIRGLGGS